MPYCDPVSLVLFEWMAEAIRVQDGYTILDIYCFRNRGACNNTDNREFPGHKGCNCEPCEIFEDRVMLDAGCWTLDAGCWILDVGR